MPLVAITVAWHLIRWFCILPPVRSFASSAPGEMSICCNYRPKPAPYVGNTWMTLRRTGASERSRMHIGWQRGDFGYVNDEVHCELPVLALAGGGWNRGGSPIEGCRVRLGGRGTRARRDRIRPRGSRIVVVP